MLISFKTLCLTILLCCFCCVSYGSIDTEINKINAINNFDLKAKLLIDLYHTSTQAGTLNKNGGVIVETLTKVANTESDNANIIGAYQVMNQAYLRLYPHLKTSEEKAKLIYYYAFYLFRIQENKKAIQLLLTKGINSQNVQLCDIKNIVLLTRLYSEQGEYENAIEWCKKGLTSLKNNTDDWNYLALMTNIVSNASHLKKYDEVLAYSKKILPLLKNNPNFAPNYHNNLGIYYLENENYQQARYHFEQSKKYRTMFVKSFLDDRRIGLTYQKEGNYEKSMAIFHTILTQLHTKYPHFLTEEVAEVYGYQAQNYYLKKDFKQANIYSNTALDILKYKNSIKNFKGNKVVLLDILISKSTFNLLTKDKNQQLNTLIVADSLIDLMRQEHTEQGSKLFWREKTHFFYENALETCYRLKDYEKAFYFMEKSRAILLLDALRNLDARELLNPKQQNEEQTLRYAVVGIKNKLEAVNENNKNYQATFQQLFEAKEKYQRFIKNLEKTNPTFYRLKYDVEYVKFEQWQEHLIKNKQTAIQYFVGDGAVYALAISNQKTILKKINIDNYRHLALNFIGMAAQKPYSDTARATNLSQISHQLYKLIFEPFNLPKGRVIISPDGYFIPFNALISNNKTNKYLLQDYAFSYAYSANLLLKKEETKWQFRNNLLTVSPVNFKDRLYVLPLTNSDISAENIMDKYFSGKSLANEDASKGNFIKNAGNYKFIQLFTHGNADSTDEGSKIYFQDDILTLKELYSLEKLNADLVVLSACQTNLGKIATGEGVMSVARGFAYLDVPSTISTLWSVETLATYKITEAFYKYLHEGYEKDIALQMAQKEYLDNTDETMPYYWSGMVLVGKADKIPINLLFYMVLLLFLMGTFVGVKVIKSRGCLNLFL